LETLKDVLKGLPEAKIREIQIEVWQQTDHWFMPASKLAERRKDELVLMTSCKALDNLLSGGIRSGIITEFAGEYAAGKTQCLKTILTETLGRNPDYMAMYYDTEKTFREFRVAQIAKARGYDPDDILKRTIYGKTESVENFEAMVNAADVFIKTRNVKLILVDSITAQLRAEYIGRENLQERQGKLNAILHQLLSYADGFNLAVVVTNQVVSDPSVPYSFDPVRTKIPIGGNIQAHNAETRIYLRKAATGTVCIARLIDSSWLPPGEIVFKITEKGIEDVEENK